MNRQTHIGGAIIIILLAGVGFWGYGTFEMYAPNSYVSAINTVNAATGKTTPGVKSFTSTEVALHKDQTSCYSSISGSAMI